jgi:hypothetical protein
MACKGQGSNPLSSTRHNAAHAGLAQQPGVVLGNGQQPRGRIGGPVDPVGPTRQGEVTMGVDHGGHRGRPPGIDHLDPGPRVGGLLGRPQPVQNAAAAPKPVVLTIGRTVGTSAWTAPDPAGATGLAQQSCGSDSGTSPCHPVGPGGFDWTLGEHNLWER